MTTATPIASTTIDADALTQAQLIALRDHINNENDSAFDYLFEGIQEAVRDYASTLIAQSLSTTDEEVDPADVAVDAFDVVDALTDALFGKVSVLIQIDGINTTDG